MSDKDEITLKEAAEYAKGLVPRAKFFRDLELKDPEKRAREVGNAGATLDTMLAASRAGKTVKGQK
jgi:hypothetical protein